MYDAWQCIFFTDRRWNKKIFRWFNKQRLPWSVQCISNETYRRITMGTCGSSIHAIREFDDLKDQDVPVAGSPIYPDRSHLVLCSAVDQYIINKNHDLKSGRRLRAKISAQFEPLDTVVFIRNSEKRDHSSRSLTYTRVVFTTT
jgi:hypothetical protein